MTDLLIYNDQRSRYEWLGDFESRAIPRGAGFSWDEKGKRWWTGDAEIAVHLADYASSEVRSNLHKVNAWYEEGWKASAAADADYWPPCPNGLEYLPFQRAGIKYAVDHPRCLIGDEMGLGKTVQALGVLNDKYSYIAPDVLVLVICPASVKINWQREAEKWLLGNWEIIVLNPKDKFPGYEKRRMDQRDARMVIVNYDILNRFERQIREKTWDCVIVDECHYLKNPSTRRSKQVMGHLVKKGSQWIDNPAPIPADRWLFLSGTPMASRPIELMPFVRFCAGKGWPGWHKYVKTYCDAYQTTVPMKGGGYRTVWDVTGASNLDKLQELCRSRFMVRRRKAQVLTDLPAKRRQVIELPINGAVMQVREEQKAWREWSDRLEELRAAAELAKATEDEQEYREALEALRQGVAVAFQQLSAVRKETAMAKVPYVIERVRDALAEGPVVLFGWHKEVLSMVRVELGGGLITGDTSMKERQQHVDDFQAGKIQLISGTMGAMGVGLTLTRSALAIFCELDWVPANVSQAEDRIHRHGQKRPVLIQHLVLPGSLDARLASTLVAKQEILDAALDDAQEFVGEIQPVIPGVGELATERATRDNLRDEGSQFSDEQIAAVHRGLRLLAEVCDGANAEDGAGFNKVDTRVGKSLALCPHLTQRQAALGQRLIQKYRRQLTDEILDPALGRRA